MRIKIDIKPSKITAKTKSELVSKIAAYGIYTCGTKNGSKFNGYVNGDHIFL